MLIMLIADLQKTTPLRFTIMHHIYVYVIFDALNVLI